MNHWFLVARDTMWGFIIIAPLFLSSMLGYGVGADKFGNENSASNLFASMFITTVIWQLVGVLLLWKGVIQ